MASNQKRAREGRPRKDQQSQATPPPSASRQRQGIKVGCGRPRPMLAPTSGDTHGINTGPPRRPIIIIDKLLAAWWSVDAASTGIKRPRGRR